MNSLSERSTNGARPDRRGRRGGPRRRRASVPPRVTVAPQGFEPVPHDPSPVAFEDLQLDDTLFRGISERGFVRTTPIQSAAIPLVLAGGDLIGCAQTGTGKTAAFLVPIVQRLLTTAHAPDRSRSTRVLILEPTRELAVQIEEDFQGLAYHTGLTAAAVYGGVDAGAQERALRAPVDIIVATPGRLIDHMGTCSPRFEGLEVLVLDEADRMLDMGFWPSVRRIVATLPPERQTLFFSATMSEDVFRSAVDIMRAPQMIQIGPAGGPAVTVTHRAHQVPSAEKTTWLAGFLKRTPEPTLIFTRTKRGADRVARRLAATGIRCAALHADRTQRERIAAVEGFRAGRYSTLVATDIAARGLDIEGIGHVINYEVPDSADAYVHRVGRTGRAEATGVALTLVAPEEAGAFRALERALNITVGSPQARR
ncbi:MAG TPA: DEAD/DEAH box helicase [Vicinamibacterales bacterium]|nr:DEAD/DEAH box helicase [Vicinamibacterales bacterium]